jgi:SPP1 gp7 family putative phage head morphogenesis protein
VRAAEAAAELEAFGQFYEALLARQRYGDHVCLAAQPDEANGSVEDLIDRGVDVGAEATAAWARQILDAVSDKSSPESILTALGGLHFDLDAFAKPIEHAMLQSAMLGVLDSEWERTHEEEIAPARFSAGPDPFANQPFGEAVKLFEQRQVLPKAAFEALGAGAKRQAFTVAGMASQEMLNVTKAELGRQLALARESGKGFNFREFKSFAKERLESAGWTPANKSHVECLLPGTPVTGAVIRAAHRRWYQGPVIEVVTASGRKFTTTPNHPMLTRRGWVSTGELRETDYLIGHRGQQGAVPIGHEHVANPPTTIAEVFRACAQVAGLEGARSTPDDFHGDGRDGDVDIARPARPLRLGAFAALTQPLEHLLFAKAPLARSRFCDRCHHLVVVTQRCGFCDAPQRNAGLTEHTADRIVAGAKSLGEVIAALAGRVPLNDLARRKIAAFARRCASMLEVGAPRGAQAAHHAGGLHGGLNVVGGDVERGADCVATHPGEIEFDRVVSLRAFEYHGHVFNLSTPHGYFTIAGLYTGNTVFRTNAMGALASGRFVEMRQPAVLAALPYWQIRGVNDSRARPTHKAAFGIVLAANDPFWVRAFPPFGYNCRCRCVARTAAWVKRSSVSIGPVPKGLPDPGFECGTSKMLLPVPDKALEKPQPINPPPQRPQPRPAPEQHAPLPPPPPPRAPGVPWVEDADAIARAGTRLTENIDRYVDAFSESTNRRPGGKKKFFKPAARRIGQEYLEELIGAVRRDANDAEFSAVNDLVESRRADGLHGWDGRVELDARAHAGAAATLRRIGQGEYAQAFRGPLPSIFEPATEEFKQRNARFRELTGLRVYFHEELHGHSPVTASSYYSVGALLEEVGTELTAREAVARAAPGLGTPEVRAWLDGAGGAYHRWIDDVTDVVMKHGGLDKAGARARIVAAHGRLLQMKERLYAAAGHLDQFVAGLDLPAERAQLVKADLANLK